MKPYGIGTTVILYITVTDNLEHSVINGCMKLLKISSANTTKHYFVATEQKEGGIGIFSFADLINNWLGFSGFRTRKLRFFSFRVFRGLPVFLNLVFSFWF